MYNTNTVDEQCIMNSKELQPHKSSWFHSYHIHIPSITLLSLQIKIKHKGNNTSLLVFTTLMDHVLFSNPISHHNINVSVALTRLWPILVVNSVNMLLIITPVRVKKHIVISRIKLKPKPLVFNNPTFNNLITLWFIDFLFSLVP